MDNIAKVIQQKVIYLQSLRQFSDIKNLKKPTLSYIKKDLQSILKNKNKIILSSNRLHIELYENVIIKDVDLGKFTVKIPIKHNGLYLPKYSSKNKYGNFRYIHPSIAKGGPTCHGNSEKYFRVSLVTGNIGMYLDIANAYLRTNTSRGYIGINAWKELAKPCLECQKEMYFGYFKCSICLEYYCCKRCFNKTMIRTPSGFFLCKECVQLFANTTKTNITHH